MLKKVLIPVLAFTLIFSTTGCEQQVEPEVKEETVLQVQTITITSAHTDQAIEITGEIKPIRSAKINSPTSDIIGEIYVDIGEEVYKGELLASLVGETTLQTIENARTGLINARQNSLLSSLSGNINVNQAEADLTKAEKQLELAHINLQTTVQAAEANIVQSEALLARTFIESDVSIDRAAQDLSSTTASALQQLDAIYDSIKQTGRSTLISLESYLEFTDTILGVRDTTINDTFQSHLGVLDIVNRDRAFAYYRDAERKLITYRTSLTEEDLETHFQKSMDAAYAMKLLLDTLSVVLRDSIVNVDLPQDMIGGFKAETDSAQAGVNQMIQALENVDQNLRATKISTESQLNNAEANLRQAKQVKDGDNEAASIREAKARLQTTRAQSNQQIEQAKKNLELTELDLQKARQNVEFARTSRSTQTNTAKTQEDSQAGQLALAIAQRNQLELKAPFDGVVTQKFANAGERVSGGTSIVEVADLSRAKVILYVNPTDALTLAIGHKVQVGEQEGEIIKIAPSADPESRKILVEAALRTSKNLIIGTFLPVQLNLTSKKEVLAVPIQSIYLSESEKYLFVLQEGIITHRSVEIGKLRGDIVEITKGLKQGDQVIIERNENIQEEVRAISR